MSETRSRNWLKISCIGCVGAPCLMLLLTFGWLKCQVNKAGDKLPGELAALKKMGVPTEPADLPPNPPLAPGQNAASLYNELIAEYKTMKEDKDKKEFFRVVANFDSYRSTAAEDALAIDGLAQIDAFLKKADRIAGISHLYFERDYSKGAMVLFPEYSNIKDIAKLEAARSRSDVKRGNYADSLKALKTIFVMGRHCTEEPTIIGVLVGVAMDSIAYANLEIHLQAIKGNQPALAEARKMLESLPEAVNLKRGLAGELVMGRQSIQSLRHIQDLMAYSGAMDSADGPENRGPNPLDRITFEDPAVRRMFEAKYVELWRKTYEKMPQDGRDWKGLRQAMDTIDEELQKDTSAENYLNQIMFPVFSQYALVGGNYQAKHRLALLAVRLLQDRPKGLPKDLSRYGNLAIDPMNGKPIHYLVKNGGFKIWGVGRNEKDDGGVKLYPGTGMSTEKVDDVLMFFYPEAPPVVPKKALAPAGSPPPGFPPPGLK